MMAVRHPQQPPLINLTSNMQAQSMLGDAELMAAGRQGDAMNFDGNYEDDVGVAATNQVRQQRPTSNMRGNGPAGAGKAIPSVRGAGPNGPHNAMVGGG